MTSNDLPYAADASESLGEAELQVLREQFGKEKEAGYPSVQTRFNLAWGLVKASSKDDVTEGIEMLMSIYREEASRRRECLYYLALGHYKIGNYDEARRYNQILLDREPSNQQAQSLSSLIERDVSREGYMGMALAGGIAAVAVTAAFALFRGQQRR